jgi:hypothetical protein
VIYFNCPFGVPKHQKQQIISHYLFISLFPCDITFLPKNENNLKIITSFVLVSSWKGSRVRSYLKLNSWFSSCLTLLSIFVLSSFEALISDLFIELLAVEISDRLMKSERKATITSNGLWTQVLLNSWKSSKIIYEIKMIRNSKKKRNKWQ